MHMRGEQILMGPAMELKKWMISGEKEPANMEKGNNNKNDRNGHQK